MTADEGCRFRAFAAADLDGCLSLFDENCPESFAPNERPHYDAFLNGTPAGYRVGIEHGRVMAAFGVGRDGGEGRCRLTWILVSPRAQRRGIGRAIMNEVFQLASGCDARIIDIAASHKSAPFFAKFGAREIRYEPDGWGPGMHRVDMELPLSDRAQAVPKR